MKCKRLILLVSVALAGWLPQSQAQVSLGSADSFAVLGGSTVTSTGATVLNGNLGVYPGTAITGFGPGIVNGTTYTGGAVAMQAQSDALSAYNTIAGLTSTGNLTGKTLGSGGTVLSLMSGVYTFSSSAELNGQLILSGPGEFIFQIGSTLLADSASSIVLENGATAANVFWDVGSSATLDTTAALDGAIIAKASITMDSEASLTGNALALNGTVTLDDNIVSVPVPAAVPDALEPGTLVAGVLLLQFGAKKFGLRLANRN
jgi:hypothetical protein